MPSRLPPSEDTERWAVDLVLDTLRRQGETVEFVRRVPRAAYPTPDFEVREGAHLVAAEVTQHWASRQLLVIAELVQDGLRTEAAAYVEGLGAGAISVYIEPSEGARERRVPAVVAAVADRIKVDAKALSDGRSLDFTVDGVLVSITRHPQMHSRLVFVMSSSRSGGATREIADRFADKLLADKARQAEAYDRAWVIVIDNMLLIDDEDDLRPSLVERSAAIPSNWARLFVITSSAPARVLEIHGFRT